MPDIEILRHIDEVAKRRALKELDITYDYIVVADYSDDLELLHQVIEYYTLVDTYKQQLLQEYETAKTQRDINNNVSTVKSKVIKYYLIAIVLICLIVPYQQTFSKGGVKITKFHGYEFVFDSPKALNAYYSPEISFQRLGLEFIAISAIAGIAYISKGKK